MGGYSDCVIFFKFIYCTHQALYNIVIICMTCVYIQDMQENIYMKHNSLPDTLLFDTLVQYFPLQRI